MKHKVILLMRKPTHGVSIERVFQEVSRLLPSDRFHVEMHHLPNGYGIAAIVKNLLFFRRPVADIYHITGDIHYMALRLPRERTVLTIHDLVFLRRRTGTRRALLKKLFLEWPVRRAAAVTTVSAATRDVAAEELPILQKPLEVIENPLPAGFDPAPEKAFAQIEPVVLQVGTAENKNLANLVAALEGVECSLRIIGPIPSNILADLEKRKIKYSSVESVSEREIAEEYRAADIVAFCSTYEGFGLPIIEAQAMRKPVVTSDRRPMTDVAGEAAVFVDPRDPASIRRGVLELINDEKLRDRLIAAGVSNVSRFDAQMCADRYAELYERVLRK